MGADEGEEAFFAAVVFLRGSVKVSCWTYNGFLVARKRCMSCSMVLGGLW